MANTMEALNEYTYNSPDVLDLYDKHILSVAETMALLKYQPCIAGHDVLDIGVGTGRTTIYLAPLAGRYECIDFSPVMIGYMKSAMPGISAQLGDMRKLGSIFPQESFDFVMASYNVLDETSHDERLRTLTEIYGVLKPQGILMFSSHNLAYEQAGAQPRLNLVRNPITQVRLILVWIRQMINYSKARKLRVFRDDYAILNDEGHDFSCLHYFISQNVQRRQLEDHQYIVLDVFGDSGASLSSHDDTKGSSSLLYVAQKAGLK